MRLALLLCCLAVASAADHPATDLPAAERVARLLAPFDTAKRPPGPNDWLAQHQEAGQTLRQYVDANPNRPSAQRKILYLQPIGAMPAAQQPLVTATADALHACFSATVQQLKPLALGTVPVKARRAGPLGEQLHSGWLLNQLRAARPADAIATLGLTSQDLWPGDGWNFVFGEARLTERVGVWSLVRFGGADEPKLTERTLKLAVHETGHQFGMLHCINAQCLMNGSNHLLETDASPLWFCAVCEAKVQWSFGGDPAQRLTACAAVAKQLGLATAQAEWARRAAALAPR